MFEPFANPIKNSLNDKNASRNNRSLRPSIASISKNLKKCDGTLETDYVKGNREKHSNKNLDNTGISYNSQVRKNFDKSMRELKQLAEKRQVLEEGEKRKSKYEWLASSGSSFFTFAERTAKLTEILRSVKVDRVAGIPISDEKVLKTSVIFKKPLSVLGEIFGFMIPPFLEECLQYVEAKGLSRRGIYRENGYSKIMEDMRSKIEETQGKCGFLQSWFDHTNEDLEIDSLACLFKLFIREIPDDYMNVNKYFHMDFNSDEVKNLEIVKEALTSLPAYNRLFVHRVVSHLIRVDEQKEHNYMNISNISIIFGPNLVKDPEGSENLSYVETFSKKSKIIQFILRHAHELILNNERFQAGISMSQPIDLPKTTTTTSGVFSYKASERHAADVEMIRKTGRFTKELTKRNQAHNSQVPQTGSSSSFVAYKDQIEDEGSQNFSSKAIKDPQKSYPTMCMRRGGRSDDNDSTGLNVNQKKKRSILRVSLLRAAKENRETHKTRTKSLNFVSSPEFQSEKHWRKSFYGQEIESDADEGSEDANTQTGSTQMQRSSSKSSQEEATRYLHMDVCEQERRLRYKFGRKQQEFDRKRKSKQ